MIDQTNPSAPLSSSLSAASEIRKPSASPIVGLVGLSAIGGTLGAMLGGTVGAILGGALGALSAAIEHSKSVDRYQSHTQPNPLHASEPGGFPLTTKANEAGKAIAPDLDQFGAAVQPDASDDVTQTLEVGSTDSFKGDIVRGILLDIDGTLVDSNDAHAQAWVEAFSAFGYEVPFDKVRPLIGMGADHLVPLVSDLSGTEGVGKEIADRRKELILSKASTLAPTPGSRDLVLKLKQAGFQLVVASSATREELSALLRSAQVEDLLEQFPVTTSSDASSSKPAPRSGAGCAGERAIAASANHSAGGYALRY